MYNRRPNTSCDSEEEGSQNWALLFLSSVFLTPRSIWYVLKQNLDVGLSKKDVLIWIINRIHAKRLISPQTIYFLHSPTSPFSFFFFFPHLPLDQVFSDFHPMFSLCLAATSCHAESPDLYARLVSTTATMCASVSLTTWGLDGTNQSQTNGGASPQMLPFVALECKPEIILVLKTAEM